MGTSTGIVGAKGNWESGSVGAAYVGKMSAGPIHTEVQLFPSATMITATSAAVVNLTHVLSDSIFDVSGVRLNTSIDTTTSDYQIVLEMSSDADRAHLKGGTYASVADEAYTVNVTGTSVSDTIARCSIDMHRKIWCALTNFLGTLINIQWNDVIAVVCFSLPQAECRLLQTVWFRSYATALNPMLF